MKSQLAQYALEGKTLDDVPVFDAHAHVGEWATFDSVTLDEQIAEMDRIGIDLAAVSSLVALTGDIRRGNDRIAEVIAGHPGRFVGYAHVSANYSDEMVSELERCFAIDGFRGVKVYPVGVPYDDAAFDPVWDFARDRNAPVLAHTWAARMNGLENTAQSHPDVNFLVAHAGSEFTYQAYIDAARAAGNLYLDLTYSREHTNMIEHFVESVGAERIVWGTDVPLFSMAQQASKVLCARISDSDKRKIMYDNAAGLFGLDRPGKK